MEEAKKIQALAAFEVVGPKPIRRAIERAYPFVDFTQRRNPCACFVGHAGSPLSATAGWGLMSARHPDEADLFHCLYEGQPEELRVLAIQWLAGIQSPPKERRRVPQLVAIGLALLLLVFV